MFQGWDWEAPDQIRNYNNYSLPDVEWSLPLGINATTSLISILLPIYLSWFYLYLPTWPTSWNIPPLHPSRKAHPLNQHCPHLPSPIKPAAPRHPIKKHSLRFTKCENLLYKRRKHSPTPRAPNNYPHRTYNQIGPTEQTGGTHFYLFLLNMQPFRIIDQPKNRHIFGSVTLVS